MKILSFNRVILLYVLFGFFLCMVYRFLHTRRRLNHVVFGALTTFYVGFLMSRSINFLRKNFHFTKSNIFFFFFWLLLLLLFLFGSVPPLPVRLVCKYLFLLFWFFAHLKNHVFRGSWYAYRLFGASGSYRSRRHFQMVVQNRNNRSAVRFFKGFARSHVRRQSRADICYLEISYLNESHWTHHSRTRGPVACRTGFRVGACIEIWRPISVSM